MKQISLLRNFMLNAVVSLIGMVMLAGLIVFFITPLWVSLYTEQWTWLSFNKSIGNILLSIPVALVMAGINTLTLWFERTDMPLKWKLVVWVIVVVINVAVGFGCVEIINILFPH